VIATGICFFSWMGTVLILNKELLGEAEGAQILTGYADEANLQLTRADFVVGSGMSLLYAMGPVVGIFILTACQNHFPGGLFFHVRDSLEFLIWLILACILFIELLNQPATMPESNLMTDVVVNDIFGAEFEYSDSKFVKTYQDIGNAEDFYSFLKGPVSTLMFSAQDNYLHVIPDDGGGFAQSTPIAEGTEIPVLFPADEENAGMLWVRRCMLRQVRVKKQTCTHRKKEVFCIKDFTEDIQQTKPRKITGSEGPEAKYLEKYLPSNYTNTMNNQVKPADYVTGRGIAMPGEGGFIFGMKWRTDPEDNIFTPTEFTGIYSVETHNKTMFQAEVAQMAKSRWIDQYTVLVQLMCSIDNPNGDLLLRTRHTVTITPHGKVLPEPPLALIVYSSDATSMSDFSDKMSFWLLYAFFSMGLLAIRMNQDGFRSFCSTHGSLLPIEFANIICSWMVWCMQAVAVYYYPNEFDTKPTHDITAYVYSTTMFQRYSHLAMGLTLFFVFIKLLTFFENIPYLNLIGKTFSRAARPLILFFGVFAVLMVAFACLFQIIFCINMREFRDLRWTVFTLFRGLVGDIPLDKMVYFRPQLAPVLFCVYVTIVLFTALTILIAIITDAYVEVVDDEKQDPSVGVVSLMYKGVVDLCRGDSVPDAKEDSAVEPTMADLMAKIVALEGRLVQAGVVSAAEPPEIFDPASAEETDEQLDGDQQDTNIA